MQAEPSSPGHSRGSGVTAGMWQPHAELEWFLTNPQPRAAPEGDECCVLGQLLQHSTMESPGRSQAPFVHLRDPSPDTWSSPHGEGHSQPGTAGRARTGLPCPSWALLRGTSEVSSQARIPNTSPGHVEHILAVTFKQCLSLLPCEGNPALEETLGCCRGVRACLSPTHLCALTPFLPLQVKDV